MKNFIEVTPSKKRLQVLAQSLTLHQHDEKHCQECGSNDTLDEKGVCENCDDCNEDTCRECGEDNTGGDGFDGLCGNCADAFSCTNCGESNEKDDGGQGRNGLCRVCLNERKAARKHHSY